MQLLLVSFLFLTAAAFDASSYDFGAGKALERLCNRKERKHFACSWSVDDFNPARIVHLISGWKMLNRGEVMLPLLEEVAQDLLKLKLKSTKLNAL